jgi:hypothetical protein
MFSMPEAARLEDKGKVGLTVSPSGAGWAKPALRIIPCCDGRFQPGTSAICDWSSGRTTPP